MHHFGDASHLLKVTRSRDSSVARASACEHKVLGSTRVPAGSHSFGREYKPRPSLCRTHSIIHGLERSRRSCPRRVSAGYTQKIRAKHALSPKSECDYQNGG